MIKLAVKVHDKNQKITRALKFQQLKWMECHLTVRRT